MSNLDVVAYAGRTKTEARDKLRVIMRDVANGVAMAGSGVTVEWVVRDWLAFGLVNRSPRTVELNRYLCETHVIPSLGARKLQTLTPATWRPGYRCSAPI